MICRHCRHSLHGAAPPAPTLHDDFGQRSLSTAGARTEARFSAAAPAIGRVVLVDIDIPIGSMVTFMVKWAIASIPAMLIVAGVVFAAFFLLAIVFSGLGVLPPR
jgi:hypothetical protein